MRPAFVRTRAAESLAFRVTLFILTFPVVVTLWCADLSLVIGYCADLHRVAAPAGLALDQQDQDYAFARPSLVAPTSDASWSWRLGRHRAAAATAPWRGLHDKHDAMRRRTPPSKPSVPTRSSSLTGNPDDQPQAA